MFSTVPGFLSPKASRFVERLASVSEMTEGIGMEESHEVCFSVMSTILGGDDYGDDDDGSWWDGCFGGGG
jgi:hypothetical protein